MSHTPPPWNTVLNKRLAKQITVLTDILEIAAGTKTELERLKSIVPLDSPLRFTLGALTAVLNDIVKQVKDTPLEVDVDMMKDNAVIVSALTAKLEHDLNARKHRAE